MAVELKVPAVGESITEVHIGPWKKSSGDWVERDEAIVELESDKATVELPAPVAGTIKEILKKEGETAEVGEVIGYLDDSGKRGDGKKKAAEKTESKVSAKEVTKPAAASDRKEAIDPEVSEEVTLEPRPSKVEPRVMPAARRAMAEHDLEPDEVDATGPGGRILKEDVIRAVSEQALREEDARTAPEPAPAPAKAASRGMRDEESVAMTPMRRRIAERLVEAQHAGALLTTFSEIDMGEVMELREEHKAEFQEKHGVKLGFMSFFVKASVEALKAYPKVNAEIRQGDIVYHHYYDVGIAVSGGKGLVVPVLRNAENMSFATPIVNPPQSGILGLHTIQDRPVARDGHVVIRPMMYVALTYDHRIVDGREAVTFLRRIKESIEKPARLLLEL
jgi:2-oxoglutarate dehydrogenase E2 component (dihydrolipoamide succinyltransferase)